MGIDIVPYTPQHRAGVIELQRYLWSADPAVASAHFAWKYERNPYIHEPLVYLAVRGERVVGMRGIYGAKWVYGTAGHTLAAHGAGDLVIAPEERGKGLFRDIMAFAEDDVRHRGCRYLINLSASPATYIQSVRVEWRDLGALQTLHRRSALAAFRGRLRSLVGRVPVPSSGLVTGCAAVAARQFAALDRGFRGAQSPRTGPIILEHRPRPAEMAALVSRPGASRRVRHVRDEDYFDWRFGNPLSVYRFLFWQEARIEGYLVLETPIRAHQNRVRIIDWEATTHEVRNALLRAAVERGTFNDLRCWSATLSSERLRSLEEHGFGRGGHSAGLQYRHALLVKDLRTGFQMDDEGLPDIGGWDLRMSASDKC